MLSLPWLSRTRPALSKILLPMRKLKRPVASIQTQVRHRQMSVLCKRWSLVALTLVLDAMSILRQVMCLFPKQKKPLLRKLTANSMLTFLVERASAVLKGRRTTPLMKSLWSTQSVSRDKQVSAGDDLEVDECLAKELEQGSSQHAAVHLGDRGKNEESLDYREDKSQE